MKNLFDFVRCGTRVQYNSLGVEAGWALAWLIAAPNFKTIKVTRSLFPGVLRSRCLEALRRDTKTRLSIFRECSLRSSLFRFLSGKRESRAQGQR